MSSRNNPYGATGVTRVNNPSLVSTEQRRGQGATKGRDAAAAAAQDWYNEELQQPLPNRDSLPTTATIPATPLSPNVTIVVDDVASNHSDSEDPRRILDHCRAPNVVLPVTLEEDQIQLKTRKVATLQLGQLCFHGADRTSWRTTARTLMRGITAIVRRYDVDFHFWAYNGGPNRDQPTEFDPYPVRSAHPDMIRVFVLEKHQKIIMEHCKDLFYCDCYGAIYRGLPVEFPKLLQNSNQGRGSAKFVTVELPNTAAANGSTTQHTPQRLFLPRLLPNDANSFPAFQAPPPA